MTAQRIAIALSAANLLLLIALLSQFRPASAQEIAPVLRGRSLEIVDAQGRRRATLHVEPAGTAAGVTYQESVIFRLITERGRPAVKIVTSEEQSGLSFAGPTGTSNTWVNLGAKGRTTSLQMKNEDGREREIVP